MPLIASNRIGNEEQDGYDITFYGSSFIANQFGEKVQELNETEEGVLVAQLRPRQTRTHTQRLGFLPRPPSEPVWCYQNPRRIPGVLTAMTTLNSTPRADGFYMPAEWAPQTQTWMILAERPDNWRLGGKPAQAAHVAVAKAIARFEPVTVAVSAGQY